MQQKLKSQLLLALCVTLIIVSCNSADKNVATPTTDSIVNATPAMEQPKAPDAIAAAPALYKVTADSLGIRMLEATYNPGDSSAMHAHPDYAIYIVSGGMVTFYEKDGSKMERELKTGTILVKSGEMHSVKNTGKTVVKVLMVEVNRPQGSVTMDAATNATTVAGNLYKVAADTLGIRVLEINYKPGQASAMHSHPDIALYILADSKSEFTNKDGKKNTAEMKKGMSRIGAAETHSVKNIGTTPTKAILVEVNRPRN